MEKRETRIKVAPRWMEQGKKGRRGGGRKGGSERGFNRGVGVQEVAGRGEECVEERWC